LPLFVLEASSSDEREFDKEHLEDYRNDPDFNYAQDYAPSDSFITSVLTHLWSALSEMFAMVNAPWLLPLLFKALLIGGIIGAVWLILKLRYGKLLSKDSRRFSDYPLMNSQPQDEDYQKLLKESLANNQHRLAVRYLFLSTLLLLEQQKCFKVAKWKVPHDYLMELPEEKKSDFKQLTALFEKTWYGDYQPDKDELDEGLKLYRGLQNA